MNTQRQFWDDIGPSSPSGETLPSSPNKHTFTPWTSSVVDSPASLFLWLEPEEGTLMSAGSGTPFAKLSPLPNQPTCWLKMSQGSYQRMTDGSLEQWSETWPRWGMIVNGVAFQQPPLISRTCDTESSSLRLIPTPQASDAMRKGADYAKQKNKRGGADDLQTAMIKLLATPRASDWKDCGDPGSKSQVHMLGKQYLSAQVKKTGELLNPLFVEAMMGFPIGWTELDASEMPSHHPLLAGLEKESSRSTSGEKHSP